MRAKNSSNILGKEQQIRDHLMGEVTLGRLWGPLTECPWPHARVCKLDATSKNKWDPLDQRFRLISNFSDGGEFSINHQSSSPRLIALYARGCHVRDKLAHLGKRAYCRAYDVPSCYRNQVWAEEHWYLMVYQLEREFFVDTRHGFGLVASEYAWQCVLAILCWRMRCLHGWHPWPSWTTCSSLRRRQ